MGAHRIERAREADWMRVRAVRLRALADAPDAFEITLAQDEARPEASWRERLATEEAATFLARRGSEDVGMVVGAPYRGLEGAAGLFAMWVAPEARGTGVADALVEAVVAWARARGWPRLVLDVAEDNPAATRCYERHGFRPNGTMSRMPPPREHVLEHQRELRLRP